MFIPRKTNSDKPHMRTILELEQGDERRETLLLLTAIISVVIFGILGYQLIEGWNLFDSLYMTIITLSTIGYLEVHPLSDAGRAFTILLIILGVGVVSIVLTTFAHKIIKREVGWLVGSKKMEQAIAKLKDHIIICGYGRLSRIAAARLRAGKRPVLIVDNNEDRCNQAIAAGYTVLCGDVTQEETLLKAGIQHAFRLVSLLPKESDNLYVILTSRELNPDLFILSRAEDEAGEKRLARAGATKIVSPYRAGAQKIADGLLRPYVTDFMDLADSTAADLQIEEIKIPEFSPMAGRSLKDSELRQKTNVIVAAIISVKGDMQFNPSGEAVLEGGSTLIGIGLKNDFTELEKILLGEN